MGRSSWDPGTSKPNRRRRGRRRGPALALASALVVGGSAGSAGVPLGEAPPKERLEAARLESAGPAVTGERDLARFARADALPAQARVDAPLGAKYGIPATALDAYRRAELMIARADASCRLDWTLLAGIGKVESGHANGGDLASNGDVLNAIFGPELDGSPERAAIGDGAGGWARASGPMQFLPSTWAKWSADGNGDGKRNPQNMYDAALAAGSYLCAGARNLSDEADLQEAILSYNHSAEYVRHVLSWVMAYRNGGLPVPDRHGAVVPDNRAHGSMPASPDESTEAPPAPAPAPGSDPEPQPPEGGTKPIPGAERPAPKPEPDPPVRPVLPEPVRQVLPEPVHDVVRPVEHGLNSALDRLAPRP